MHRKLLAGTALALAAGGASIAVAQGVAGFGRAEQLAQAQDVYARECAVCHGAALDGSQFAPALKGAQFLAKWQGASAGDLHDYIRNSMPPGNVGGLGASEYEALVAHILAENDWMPEGTLALLRTQMDDIAMPAPELVEGRARTTPTSGGD